MARRLRESKRDELLSKIWIERGPDGERYGVASESSPVKSCLRNAAKSLRGDVLVDDEDGKTHSFDACLDGALEGSHIQLDPSNRETASSSLLVAAFAKAVSASAELRRRELEERLHEEVPSLVTDLAPGISSFSWLFSSRSAKAKAESAYEQLESLLNNNLESEAEAVILQLRELRGAHAEQAWEWYLTNENDVKLAIMADCPEALGQDEWLVDPDEVFRALGRVNDLLRSLDAHGIKPDSLTEGIKASVQKYLASKAFEALKDIPVEELNREKLGIRVKVLRDGGYKTVADVYAASMGELSSLSGITWSSVSDAKEKAGQMALGVKEGVKLRLSADDKSRVATNVVWHVYAVKKWNELSEERKSLTKQIRGLLEPIENDVQPATKRLAWLFASEDVRSEVAAAYNRLVEFGSSDLLVRAENLLKQFNKVESLYIDQNEAWADFEANPVDTFNVLEEICPDVLGNDDTLFGLPEELAREIQDQCFFPEGLKCTLRRYQEMGVKYILHQERTLLGDEMGLGKTVQAIASMVSLRNTGETHFAVICPASVLENWCREIWKHSKLRVTKVHGASSASVLNSWLESGGVAVTTYETTKKLLLADDFVFGLAVVDEAHYIKNPEAARSINTLRLIAKARRVVFMTGTALENRVDEMLTLIGYLRPSVAASARPLAFMANAKRFRDEVAPVYYRRKREDVLTELPELIENEEWCTLGPVEKEAYERSVLTRSLMAARRVSWNVADLRNDSSKARRLLEIVNDATDDGRKILVFTFFLDTASSVVSLLGNKCVGIINGSVPPSKRQELVEKFDAAAAGSVLVSQIQAGGTGMNIQSASVVVFCEPQYKPSIEKQAVSRAYRMGQTRNVLAFRLLCEQTVDERIHEILQEKQAAFDAFADKSSAAAAAAEDAIGVDKKRMGQIIEEEIERIKARNPELVAQVEHELAERGNLEPPIEDGSEGNEGKRAAFDKEEQLDGGKCQRVRKGSRKDRQYTFNVAGINKMDTALYWCRQFADDIEVVREPENPFDENAIALCPCGVTAGYVPRDLALEIAPLLDEGYEARVELLESKELNENACVGDRSKSCCNEVDSEDTYFVARVSMTLYPQMDCSSPDVQKKEKTGSENTHSRIEADEITQQRSKKYLTADEINEFSKRKTCLSERQMQVAGYLAQGMSRSETASTLGIGADTLKSHVREVYRKLGIRSQRELVEYIRDALGDDSATVQNCSNNTRFGVESVAGGTASGLKDEPGITSRRFVEKPLSSEEIDDRQVAKLLRDAGLRVVDKRPKGGALWVVADESVRPLMSKLRRDGFRFTYKKGGGRATGGKDAWWLSGF